MRSSTYFEIEYLSENFILVKIHPTDPQKDGV